MIPGAVICAAGATEVNVGVAAGALRVDGAFNQHGRGAL